MDIVAVSQEARQVMLEDGTLLSITHLHGEDGREVEDWDDAKSFIVTDHRTRPVTRISIQLDAIEYSPEA